MVSRKLRKFKDIIYAKNVNVSKEWITLHTRGRDTVSETMEQAFLCQMASIIITRIKLKAPCKQH